MDAIASVLANVGDRGDHDWWPLLWLLWLALIVGVAWLVARRWRPGPPSGRDRARDILAERYARGEISGDEYRERLAAL